MNLLGIDVGTTSVKAAAFDENGKMLFCRTYDYNLITSGDTVEFAADDYIDIVKTAISDARAEAEIYALAVDTQCETLILTDDNGKPLHNAVVWLDNRASEEALEIKEAFGNRKVYEITGQPEITATWPASKLLWFKKNLPEVFEKTRKIFLLDDYILYKLTGEFVTEKSLQSSSLYFDIRNGEWWDEMLTFLGVSKEKLPRLFDSAQYVGDYNGIKVMTSGMDQVAAAIGAGVLHEGDISEMTGTSMVLFAPCNSIPAYDPDSIIPCHYNFDGGYARILWTQTAGIALKWFKNNFCEDFSFADLDKLAEEVPPGCDGLTMLPHLSGSTMPKYNPSAKGSFTGVTLQHTRGHFVRSILEAVSAQLRENIEYLPYNVTSIKIMGGGAMSPLWCQIKADMTGKTLNTLKNRETACLGSAILAGVGCGVFESVKSACVKIVLTDKTFSSSGVNYDEVFSRYKMTDNLLNPV